MYVDIYEQIIKEILIQTSQSDISEKEPYCTKRRRRKKKWYFYQENEVVGIRVIKCALYKPTFPSAQ